MYRVKIINKHKLISHYAFYNLIKIRKLFKLLVIWNEWKECQWKEIQVLWNFFTFKINNINKQMTIHNSININCYLNAFVITDNMID